jgi:heme-degrading monooxygenase HmoA
MYVRVAIGQIKPGMLDQLADELIRGFEESIAKAQQAPGLLGVQLLVNQATNTLAIISRWASQADEQASWQSRTQEQIAKFAANFAEPPVVQVFKLRYDLADHIKTSVPVP